MDRDSRERSAGRRKDDGKEWNKREIKGVGRHMDRGGAADDADGATGEERTSGGGGGGEGEDGRGRRGHTFFCGRVEGKSKCAHHMANGHCSRRRRLNWSCFSKQSFRQADRSMNEILNFHMYYVLCRAHLLVKG